MRPARVNPFVKLISAIATTTTPTMRKNRCANAPLTTDVRPPRVNSPGVVPIANAPIITAACNGFPVLTANNCMACVKPHGRKKVAAPIRNAFLWLYSRSFRVCMPSFLARPLGRVSPRVIRGNISVSCNPSTSMTAPTAIVIRPSNVPLSANAEPIAPMNAPNAMNETIRPALKNKCGRNFCNAVSVGWFSAYLEATLMTRPPIRAMQVENPAVNPTKSAIVPVLLLLVVEEVNLSIPNT